MILFFIFLSAFLLIMYTYLIYPGLLGILAKEKNENQQIYQSDKPLPFVSIIISAFNEEKVIGEKLQSIYSGNFSPDKFEVIIGSDASDDRTAQIIKDAQLTYTNLQFFDFKERRGKQNVVNDIVLKAQGEILIFTDANVMFDKDTIFELIKHFKNESIGLVDSNMINTGLKKEGISYQEKAYISREVKIKSREGIIWGAMMGPFGGCYAIRKKLFKPVPSNFLVDDFYINMIIFEQGYKAINNFKSKVYEEIPDNLAIEFKRKIRIGTGNFQNLRRFRKLLLTHPFGFPFISHKVIRWFGPFLMIIALCMHILLAFQSWFFAFLLIPHLGIYTLPVFDFLLKKMNVHVHKIRMATHFFAMNLALLIGFFKSFTHIKSGAWERTQRS